MTIKTILSKPLPVIWFRAVQLFRLKGYHRTGFWPKIEMKVSRMISTSNSVWSQKSLFFSPSFKGYSNGLPDVIHDQIRTTSKSVLSGEVSVFDYTYLLQKPYNWHMDWRVGHTWENKYFKEYGFYEKEKKEEYDVKFPWELSRLSFLIPVARHYLLDGDKEHLDYIHEVLNDWKTNNPIAHSVNWYPMEVSIRSINLVQLREIVLQSPNTGKTVNLINEILILHGVFLWRNIEYTDVRGNHYSANLTALLLLGNVFGEFFKEAKKWLKYALSKIEKEFHLQFYQDGVNFEKSIPYHRLVVELFLISFLTMERMGVAIKPKTVEIFRNACLFTKAYTKPDSLAPIIGDNDSASVFENDGQPLNDHSNLLQLASWFLKDDTLNIVDNLYLSAVEVFNLNERPTSRQAEIQDEQLFQFPDGGFFIAKNKEDYFITDVGEVGMKGRGGHGHNDLYSFELMLSGKDFIVDPGCYTYTGNLELKNEMKSSSYHNILTIDEEEIAPLIGNWGIADVAKPLNVEIVQEEDIIRVSGKHHGFMRLNDPVEHKRVFSLDQKSFQLLCTDAVKCRLQHKVQRHIHFAENVAVEVTGDQVVAKVGGMSYLITFDKLSSIKEKEFQLSYNYGHRGRSKKIVLESKIKGNSELFFAVKKYIGNE